jgi:hypothetical protein
MSTGIMACHLLSASIAGEELAWVDLYDLRPFHPLRKTGLLLELQATVARHFIGDRLQGSGASSVDETAPGAGPVIRLGAERRAVYRDGHGARTPRAVGEVHPPGLHRSFQRRRTRLGMPLPRLAVRPRWLGDPGPANKPLARKDVGGSGEEA